MRNSVLIIVLWLMSMTAWSSATNPQKLSEVISQTDLLAASALAYFKINERARDERNLTAAYSSLYTLEMCMAHQEQPPAQAQPLAQMKVLLAQLESLPASQREEYPRLLLLFLTEHQKLRQAAVSTYAGLRSQTDTTEQMLSDQSHDLAGLLLDYQIRHYPQIASLRPTMAVSEREMLTIAVDQRFKVLMADLPEHAESLGKINAQYRFIRSQLISPDERLQTGVEFYLSRVVLDLQEMLVVLNTGDAA